MLGVTRRLREAFDFVRGREGDFGKLTPYASGGFGAVRLWSFSVELGRAWTLPALDGKVGSEYCRWAILV